MAKDILDHIHWKTISDVFREWARVLKPGGWLYLREVPDFERDAMQYFNGKRDNKSWENFQRWVERLSYPGENLRTKNLLDFPHLKMMLEEQSLIAQKHWYQGERLSMDCQKL